MFRTRLTLAAAALALAGFSLLPSTAVAEDDNDCHRLDMEVRCIVTPSKIVLVGDPFEVTSTVRNTGDLALSNVTLALRGHEGVTQVGSEALAIKIGCGVGPPIGRIINQGESGGRNRVPHSISKKASPSHHRIATQR